MSGGASTFGHVGRGEWHGWIPDCPCRRCLEALAEKRQELRRPTMRLITGDNDDDDQQPAEQVIGWASEPTAIVDLAVALEQLVGPAPGVSAAFTAGEKAWHERYHWAGEVVAQVANRDPQVLRALISTPPEVGKADEPGRGLLILAATILEAEEGAP